MNKQQAETYPYNLIRRVPYLTRRSIIEVSGVYNSYTDTGDFNLFFNSDLDIMDFDPAMDKETKNEETVNA